MRFLAEVKIPVEKGNSTILDGTLMHKIQSAVQNLKPEAVYFVIRNGQRTMYAVFDLKSEDQLVSAFEPFWLDFNAEVNVFPAMTPADLEKAGPVFHKIVESRKK